MELMLLILLIFIPGCHFCADEMNMIFVAIPFVGAASAKLHNLLHREKCPHREEK